MMNLNLHFLNLSALWLFLLVPLAIALVLLARKRSRQIANAWGTHRHRQSYDLAAGRKAYVWKGVFAALALVAGALAIMRPALSNAKAEFPAGRADLVVLLDVSRSMAAKDCNGKTRLATARELMSSGILPSLNNNRVGLILFAGKAVPQVFLTPEMEKVYWLLDNSVTIASAPGDGSALGQAFGLACRYFDVDSKVDAASGKSEREKIIVLLSDGGTDDETRYEEIVSECKKRNVKVLVCGFGQTTPARIPVTELPNEDQLMARGPFYQVDGQDAKTALDEQLLSKLAQACSGTYVHVNDAADARFERLVSGVEKQTRISEKELFWYPTLACWVLMIASAVATRGGAKSTASANRHTASSGEDLP